MYNRKPTIAKFFWLPIETEETARRMRVPALAFGAFSTFVWFVIAVGNFFSPSIYGNWSIVNAALFGLISWGLYKMRREAAIAGFIVSLIGLILDRGISKTTSDLLLLVLDIFALRGTFAYVRLGQKPTEIMKEKSSD